MLTTIPTPEYLPIADILINGGTQSRVKLNWDVIAEYAEALETGVVFPPIIVFEDGNNYWLADGFHRLYATKKIGRQEIAVDVRKGSYRNALLFSVGANTNHGLRRSNADKRRSVEIMLRDDEWCNWSNREIAKRCGVSEFMVRQVRESICDKNANSKKRTAQRQGKIYTLDTTNIGDTRIAQFPELSQLDVDSQGKQLLIHTDSPQISQSNDQNGVLLRQSCEHVDIAIDDGTPIQKSKVQLLDGQELIDIHQQLEQLNPAVTTAELKPQDTTPNKIAVHISHLSPEQLAWVISVSASRGLSELHLKALIKAAQQALDVWHIIAN